MGLRTTVKNGRSGSRLFMNRMASVPVMKKLDTNRSITYKVPINLVEPNNLLKARQKDKVNTKKTENKKRMNAAEFVAHAERKRKLNENSARRIQEIVERRSKNTTERNKKTPANTVVASSNYKAARALKLLDLQERKRKANEALARLNSKGTMNMKLRIEEMKQK